MKKIKSKKGLNKKKLLAELNRAAIAFYQEEIWDFYELGEIIAIEVPNEKFPLFGTVMGGGGMEYGLMFTRGKDSLSDMDRMLSYQGGSDDAYDETNILGFSMITASDIPPEKFEQIRKTATITESGLVPFIVAKNKGELTREVNLDEAKILLYAINGILKAYRDEKFISSDIDEDPSIVTLRLSGSPLSPDYEITETANVFQESASLRSLPKKPADLKSLPRLGGCWVVGFPILPMSIENDNRSVRGVLVADEVEQMIIQLNLVMGGDLDEAVNLLFATFAGNNPLALRGVPAEIVFVSESLFNAASPILKTEGVSCSLVESHEFVEDIIQTMGEQMGSPPPPTSADLFEPVPASEASVKKKRGTKSGKLTAVTSAAPDSRLFTFDVTLIGGPVSEDFAMENEIVVRTIEIRADQTLSDLHQAIFDAFDRDEEHLYEFRLGGKGPRDRNAGRYIQEMEGWGKSSGFVHRTRIGDLELKTRGVFYYWFDFGDSWWHKIKVKSIKAEAPAGRYPKLVGRVGESPPQYIPWDDDDEDCF